MSKPTAFEVLSEMSNRNTKSLKGFGRNNIISVHTGKTHATLALAIDNETATRLMMQDPIHFMLIVAGDEDYKRIEAELTTAEEATK